MCESNDSGEMYARTPWRPLQIFAYLEENELLDMENPVHSTCLFLVFHRRIQAALDRARDA